MTILRGCDIKWRIRATFGSCGLICFSSANSQNVTLTACEMRLALPFLGFENWVVKEAPKNDHFQRLWHKMALESHFWKLWVKFFSCAKSSSVTLTAGEMEFALAFLGSEKWVVKKGLKNGVLGTLRCRQIGRRGLNRKTVMIDRFLVPDYPPVQIFSEIKRKSRNAQSGFFCTIIYRYIEV